MRQIHLPRVDSTNDYLKRLLAEEPRLEEYTLVTATEQTAGRGQRGHRWDATPGANLTMTLLLRPQEMMRQGATLFDLNILTTLSVRRVLLRMLPPGDPVEVKWPNDLLVGGRKISGILIENHFLGRELQVSIIGIGVNVRQETFGDDYPTPPTSIALEQRRRGEMPITEGSRHDRLAMEIVEAVKELRQTDLRELRAEYHRVLYRRGEAVLLRFADGTLATARLLGVLSDGRLEVQHLPSGRHTTHPFGTVSLLADAPTAASPLQ